MTQASIDVSLNGVSTRVLVDSGASCNLLGESTLGQLQLQGLGVTLTKCTRKLFAYGAHQLNVVGKFTAIFQCGSERTEDEVIVVRGDGEFLLGRSTALKLKALVLPDVNQVGSATASPSTNDEIKNEYPGVFSGVGKLIGYQARFHVDSKVPPVAQRQRRIPYAYETRVDEKLQELQQSGIIEEAVGPTPWVSPIVIAPKKHGDIRLCVDLRRVNEAIVRERHPMPTTEELLHEVNGSTVFSKIDLKWGFHQVELEEESRYLTTFAANGKLYRFHRLPFGISSAPELYQKIISDVIKDLAGCRNGADDILLHADSLNQHDVRVHALMNRLQQVNLTVNPAKCEFAKSSIEFFGLQRSDKGIQPTPERIRSLAEASRPSNASEVRSFLGTAGFSAKFIPDFATVAEPLRRLTVKGAQFKWTTEQQQAFDHLKRLLVSSSTLAYYDAEAPIELVTDASPVGLGAVLVQKQDGVWRPVAYASRSLAAVERRYSQTKREALGIVWACERFHTYLLGREFTVCTDHKPLEVIYSARSKPSARIERWVLRLQPYSYRAKHIPGKTNIADALPRLPVAAADPGISSDEESVRLITQTAAPIAIGIRTIERSSAEDEELSAVRKCLHDGSWDGLPAAYRQVRGELTVVGKVVLRGQRIVIPTELRHQTVQLAHEGHQGIVKTKERLRSKVWWPGMDSEAEKLCKSCHACQVVAAPANAPPVKSTPLPDAPWQHLAVDLLGPLPSGEHIVVLVDYYSRYFEVDVVKSTSAEAVIPMIEAQFSRHGIPTSLRTDNGPPFNSEGFAKFLHECGVQQLRTTPLWPRANGEVERQNRSLMKVIRAAYAEGKTWKREVQRFLMAYRSTPHSTTGVAPAAELLFGRKVHCKIPALGEPATNEAVRDRDSERKQSMRDSADDANHATSQSTQIGDSVLLKRSETRSKVDTPFHHQPHVVVSRNGDQVVVQAPDGKLVRRNVQFTKPFRQHHPAEPSPEVQEAPQHGAEPRRSDRLSVKC